MYINFMFLLSLYVKKNGFYTNAYYKLSNNLDNAGSYTNTNENDHNMLCRLTSRSLIMADVCLCFTSEYKVVPKYLYLSAMLFPFFISIESFHHFSSLQNESIDSSTN